MASAPLVIGYGNPLRADDGLGWTAAQRLAETSLPAAARVLAVHQLTPELAEPISRAGLVIFVDAREGDGPGRVHWHAVAPGGGGALAFSHELHPAALLGLARALYGACPPAIVVSVDGVDFEYGVVLSPAVQAALPEVLDRVRTLLSAGPSALREDAEREAMPCTS